MRPMGGLLLTAAVVVSAPGARAQSAAPNLDAFIAAAPPANAALPNSALPNTTLLNTALLNSALLRAVFVPGSANTAAPAYRLSSGVLRADPEAGAALDGPFVLPTFTGAGRDQARFLGPGRVVGGGLAVWSDDEVTLGSSAAGVDTVRLSLGSVARARGGVVTARPDSLNDPETAAFDLRYIHGWPSALKWSAAGYALDFSPHAALGVSNAGGTAEAGAMVRFGTDLGEKVARKLGLHEVDGDSYGQRGRWYLFAAASGQAVGLNMSPGAPGLPRNSWSMESTGTLISDAQAGVGWRKGDMQASFGYVHRDIRNQSGEFTNGVNPAHINDSMVAFSLSIHPH